MSEQIVTISNNTLAMGGVGLGSSLFLAKPQFLELVQRTSKAEGATPGKYRCVSTNEHWDELRVVLLAVPQEQRSYYDNSKGFSKDAKVCFSTDNVQPSKWAKVPQAMFCASCSRGETRWKKWRETRRPEDLPQCQLFYSLLLADRNTQTVYRMSVSGTSVMPFKNYMESAIAPLLQKIMADVRQKNKQLGYSYVPAKGTFVPTEGYTTLPTVPALPLPSVYDLSFTMYVTQREKGGVPVMGFKDAKYMLPEDRAEFGALYLELDTQRRQHADNAVEAEAEEITALVTEPAQQPPVILPGAVSGTVVGPEEPITI